MTLKKIIIVLGMHRSGTSALTRGLSTLGVALGDSLHPAGVDNPTGFWEDSDVIAINDRLLAHLGSAYDRVGLVEASIIDDECIEALSLEAKNLLITKTRESMTWGMKDPRLPRLLPFWQRLFRELNVEVGYVIALRNPLNVADSLAHRNNFPPLKSYLLWLEHMLQAVAYTKDSKRLVVSYDELMSHPRQQLLRISDALELPEPVESEVTTYINEFLDENLRHGARSEAELINGHFEPQVMADSYVLLSDCAHDRLSMNSQAFEHRLALKLAILRRLGPMSRLVASAERDSDQANHTIQHLNVALHAEGEHLRASLKALHHANLENIAQQAQIVALSEFQQQPLEGDQALVNLQAAEIKGLEALLASFKYETDKMDSQYRELLAEKEQALIAERELAERQSLRALDASATSGPYIDQLKEEAGQLRTELAELANRHQQLRVNLSTSLKTAESSGLRAAALEASLAESQAAVEAGRQDYQLLQEQLKAPLRVLKDHAMRNQQQYEYLQVHTQAWASLFQSRAWRILKLVGGHKDMPRIVLPDGATFDPEAYLEANADVRAAGIPAHLHYLCHGMLEGRLAAPAQTLSVPEPQPEPEISIASVPVPGIETPVVVDDTIPGSWEQSLVPETPLADVIGDDPFNRDFYLSIYPDIALAGIDAEQHYRCHGKSEGRLGDVPAIPLSGEIVPGTDGKPTILLISHEASRTGAPILSLNIVQQLTPHYNVVTLLFGGGPLEQAFVEAGSVVAGPVALKHRPVSAQWVMDKFLDKHHFEFAIVNSLESYVALKPLAEHFIPTISLIHEFAVYTRPRIAIQNALLWASQTVFSADVTLESATLVLPELKACGLPILSQGKSHVPGELEDDQRLEAEKFALEQSMRPGGRDDGTIVILGAGWVQIRKGVDLFIECATRVLASPIGHRCRFVWIGNNYDPEHDTLYSVYLHDQIQRAGISDRFAVINETAAIEHVYALSDMLLLSSRLDPLPNVAIDAMVRALPVLCFDRTTGIADILKRNGLQQDCVAPYLDTHHMADLLIRLASSRVERLRVGQAARTLAEHEFNMPTYVDKLVALTAQGVTTAQQERHDGQLIAQAEVLDLNYYSPANVQFVSADEAIRRYVRSWGRGVLRRKLFPGFDPGMYRALNADSVGSQDPLAHYLQAGRPQGPWLGKHLAWDMDASSVDTRPSLLFVSVRSYAALGKVLEALDGQSASPELIVLVPDALLKLEIARQLSAELRSPLRTLVCGTQPLVTLLCYLAKRDYHQGPVGHLNLAQAPEDIDFSSEEAYHHYLIENLVGGLEPAMQSIIGALASTAMGSRIGLVYPDDPNVHEHPEDEPVIAALCDAFGYPAPVAYNVAYPVNSVFWTAPSLLQGLVNAPETWKLEFKHRVVGSLQQERVLAQLIAQAALSNGQEVVTTVVSGVTY